MKRMLDSESSEGEGVDCSSPSSESQSQFLRPHKALKRFGCSEQNTTVDSRDLISELPDHLLWSIFSNLTMKDALKTVILSRRWVDVGCSAMSTVTLDWRSMFMSHENQHLWERSFNYQLHLGAESPSIYGDLCEEFKEKIVQGIDCFIEYFRHHRCQGLDISSFKLCFCLGPDHTAHIDRWLTYVLSMGVENFTLDLYCAKNRLKFCCDRSIELNLENKYIFRGELLRNCKTKLKAFHLSACLLGPYVGAHFSSLQNLTLNYVPLASYDLQNLFCYMGNLEKLTFGPCSLPKKLSLGLLLKLECVEIVCCVCLEEIQLVNNFRLKKISCREMDGTIRCNFGEAPNLERLQCPMDEEMLRDIFACLPKDTPLLRSLHVCSSADWVNCIPNNISVFRQVRFLRLYLRKFRVFNCSKIISILAAFPVLLVLHLSTMCFEGLGGDHSSEDSFDYTTPTLERVEISGFNNTPREIVFITYLLKRALNLRSLIVQKGYLDQGYGYNWRPWAAGEQQMIRERVKEFPSSNKLVLL